MSVSSLGLVVLWLLPLTSGQNHTVATPTEGGEASSWRPASEVAGGASTTFLPASPTAATPSDSTPPRFSSTEDRKSTTENPVNATTSATTGDGSDQTTWPPPRSSAQTPPTGEGTTQPATRPTASPSLISTTNTWTRPVENKTPPGPHTTPGATPRATPGATPRATPGATPGATPRATPGATPGATPRATPKTASSSTVKATETRPGKKEQAGRSTHSRVVAGLIGGALLVMLLGFLLVYVRKRTLQKQQMATGEWAGISPFLEGGASAGQVAMRPSNRISLASFLSHRLSRRLSAPPDTELDAVMTASTFGGERKGSRVDGGAAGLAPEGPSNGDAPEAENSNNNNNNNNNNNKLPVSAEAGSGAA